MDITQVIARKDTMEQRIRAFVEDEKRKFEAETGIPLTDLVIETEVIRDFGDRRERCVVRGVRAEVRI